MSPVPRYRDDRLTLYHGDCLEVLAELPDVSVDSIVTDPPYELGFMGRRWDASGIAYNVDLWKHCLRVLKPGGHLLAFGGTRTYHRMTCAIEDAGFEIRDEIAWLYGCHDDQTEILTRRGWINGLDLREDDDVAQWATDGAITLVRPIARQRYQFDGRMIRFRNADVDQLVTPNHRVYRQVATRTQAAGKRIATWTDWQVDEAGAINRWQPMRLPAAGIHDGPGIGGTDYAALLGWVWTEGGFDLSGTGIRIYQSSANAPLVGEIAALLDRLGPHKRYDYQRKWKNRPYIATTWYISGDLAQRVRADLPGKAPTWALLWRMTADEKCALWDAAMKGDGSKGVRAFWQKDRAALEWAQALLVGIGARGKVADDPRGVLHWQPSATVELQLRHLVDAGENYAGEVWCVTVPSGAFVIRRNGRVSVSGNSGFPKSLDVSKAIDKAAGAERPVVGLNPRAAQQTAKPDATSLGRFAGTPSDLTAPATDDAKRWEGWGTALKPAHEPIVVARKPMVGTVAVNVLAHGTGGLNIDTCRVGDEVRVNPSAGNAPGHPGGAHIETGATRGVAGQEAIGRWPTNVVMDEAAAQALDEQSGTLKSGANPARRGSDKFRDAYGEFAGQEECTPARGADSGGASRFFPVFRYQAKAPTKERPKVDGVAHPTVKPLELMRWLVRLVTPPGGVVLDPFAGSGTTAQAAMLEGMCCVTIEREAAYLPLIAERLGITLETPEAESAPVAIEDREDRSTWTPERWMDHFLSGAS